MRSIRASRWDRKEYLHAFNSSAFTRRDFRVFTPDFLRCDIVAFQRSLGAGEKRA
jgi:hypothetical protein